MTDTVGFVDVRALRYRYPHSEQPALDGVDLDLPSGSFTVVMGAAGAGKSSLAMTLNGVIPQLLGGTLEGRIRLDGADLAQHRVQTITRFVGLLLQDPEAQVVGRTVLEDAAFGPRNHQLPRAEILRRVHDCLALVGLDGMEERLTCELSGGELQRLALAGILAMVPQVICLDEPASQLDPAGRHEIYAAVDALRRSRRCTLVVVEHEPAEVVPRADRLVVLDRGKVGWQGPPASFFADPQLVARFRLRPVPVTEICAPLLAAGLLDPSQMPLDVDAAEHRIRELAASRGVRLAAPRQGPPVADPEPVGRPGTPAGRPAATESAPAVEIHSLRHVFPGGTTGLDGVDLRVEAGDFVALVGRNGAGKTTLVRHLNGLLQPTSGSVFIDGIDVTTRPTRELARTVGFVFQNPDHQIFCRTVADEVGYGLRTAGATADEVGARVGEVLDFVGLTAQREEHPLTLSRGQRRLVAMASVLVLDPRVLVVDEPTTGQDRAGVRALMSLVDRLHEHGTTVVMISHDMDLVARHARRVVALDAGRIVADGPTARVLADPELRARGVAAPTQTIELCTRLWPGRLPLLDEAELGAHLLAQLTGGHR